MCTLSATHPSAEKITQEKPSRPGRPLGDWQLQPQLACLRRGPGSHHSITHRVRRRPGIQHKHNDPFNCVLPSHRCACAEQNHNAAPTNRQRRATHALRHAQDRSLASGLFHS